MVAGQVAGVEVVEAVGAERALHKGRPSVPTGEA